MKRYVRFCIGTSFAFLALVWDSAAIAAGRPIAVVAVENFYGDIARQIGGEHVTVTSIINNPSQDPHLFEVAPGMARQLADAQIVVANGAGYDPWIDKLLKMTPGNNRFAYINVAELPNINLPGINPDDNPHLWYDPRIMPEVARALAQALSKIDPAHADDYIAGLKSTLASLARISQRVAHMKAKYAGTPVTATEPIFGPMANAIGLTMRNTSFQIAMMNGTEPSARDVAAFENDLKQRKVKVLIYNKQVSEKMTERLRDIAAKAKIPVVGVTETIPANISFQDWVLSELDDLDKALSGPNS